MTRGVDVVSIFCRSLGFVREDQRGVELANLKIPLAAVVDLVILINFENGAAIDRGLGMDRVLISKAGETRL